MGDKNNTVRITCTSTQVKTGHAVLKAVYVTVPGDSIYEIIDGTCDAHTTVVNLDLTSATFAPILMPYINHPIRDGLRVQVVSGTTGEILVVYE
jgi:hypothetical protein